jgi:hypothetical protein
MPMRCARLGPPGLVRIDEIELTAADRVCSPRLSDYPHKSRRTCFYRALWKTECTDRIEGLNCCLASPACRKGNPQMMHLRPTILRKVRYLEG